MTDPYEVLNVSSAATDEEVKKAYRDLARKYPTGHIPRNTRAGFAQEEKEGEHAP